MTTLDAIRATPQEREAVIQAASALLNVCRLSAQELARLSDADRPWHILKALPHLAHRDPVEPAYFDADVLTAERTAADKRFGQLLYATLYLARSIRGNVQIDYEHERRARVHAACNANDTRTCHRARRRAVLTLEAA
jgi:hypothetical protein